MVHTINIEGQDICYSESGPEQGRGILLMHGWGCDHTTLKSIEDFLASLGMHVFSIDFPGHGASPEPPEAWGVDRYASLTEAFMRRVCPDVHVLLGHSFGGRVGILLSSRNAAIRKLILVDAAGVKPRRPLKYYIKVYGFKAGKVIWRLLLGRERAQKRIESMRARRGSADYAAASPMMRRVLSRVVNEDLKDVMPGIKASTLLVWGENDTATPLRDAKVMERLIPDAGLVSFAGCGHYSFLDNPRGFRAVINEFLKDDIK